MKEFIQEFVVELNDTAKIIGSGDLEVLATPTLLAKVETVAKSYLQQALDAEETSIGTSIMVNHLRPSRVGAVVQIEIVVEAQEKTKIDFSFRAFSNKKLIATGTHQRAVLLTKPFLQKLEQVNSLS